MNHIKVLKSTKVQDKVYNFFSFGVCFIFYIKPELVNVFADKNKASPKVRCNIVRSRKRILKRKTCSAEGSES